MKINLQICDKDGEVPGSVAIDDPAAAAGAAVGILLIVLAAADGEMRGAAAVQLLQAVARPRPLLPVHPHDGSADRLTDLKQKKVGLDMYKNHWSRRGIIL
jgi:hypothetical protein